MATKVGSISYSYSIEITLTRNTSFCRVTSIHWAMGVEGVSPIPNTPKISYLFYSVATTEL